MAFLDELGRVISDKGKEAANKVKDLTGVLQLKSKLSTEREKVNKAYISLGKAYYEKSGVSIQEEYEEEWQTIQTGLTKISVLEDEIAELEGTRVCAECGAKVDKEALFCSRCGAPMEERSPKEAKEETADTTAQDESIFEEEDSENEE